MKAILNKQATFNYELLDKYVAGVVLHGHEVKATKAGEINLKGSYITIKKEPSPQLYLTNAHISLYKKAGNVKDYDPLRQRQLLITKKELNFLLGKIEQKGLTLIPLKVYTIRNLIKLEFALARGKKKYEKKEAKKQKDVDREIHRTLKMQ
jgi:SsrA-binding protein